MSGVALQLGTKELFDAETIPASSRYQISIRAELDFDGRWFARQVAERRDLALDVEGLQHADDLRNYLEGFSEEVLEMVGDEVDRMEARIREKLPRARHIEIEPD